jgi:hypothetical protein
MWRYGGIVRQDFVLSFQKHPKGGRPPNLRVVPNVSMYDIFMKDEQPRSEIDENLKTKERALFLPCELLIPPSV